MYHQWPILFAGQHRIAYNNQILLMITQYNFGQWFATKPFIHIISMMNQGVIHMSSTRPRLTHWGRVTHICVSNLTIIASDNGLLPGRRQAIIWTNAGILLIGPLGTHFSEILIGIQTLSFKKMHLKMPSAKWRPFCLGLNVLISKHTVWTWVQTMHKIIFFSLH